MKTLPPVGATIHWLERRPKRRPKYHEGLVIGHDITHKALDGTLAVSEKSWWRVRVILRGKRELSLPLAEVVQIKWPADWKRWGRRRVIE